MFHESQFLPETIKNMESKRKKWTAKEEITDSLIKFREKRKWQVAFRRYILEKNASYNYAAFFGLDIENYRNWIGLQFTEELNWENFGEAWQFDHIVPVSYFDFSNEADLALCWNFINIRVEKLEQNKLVGNRIDILAAKPYFEALYKKTGYSRCLEMVEKINRIESSNIAPEPKLEGFIIDQKEQLEKLRTLSAEEFNRLNQGTSLGDIYLERDILRKFG